MSSHPSNDMSDVRGIPRKYVILHGLSPDIPDVHCGFSEYETLPAYLLTPLMFIWYVIWPRLSANVADI